MTNDSRDCTCSVCGKRAHAIPGKKHRRCGGSKGAALRRKPAPISKTTDHYGRPMGYGPHDNQGTWS